ncbi:MAG TPA: Crp/Fnr family transcriptional regulator [Clostridia bacterium]|nr:Crp/Fnr family transcriptional regulator [Clostridia bacterium]
MKKSDYLNVHGCDVCDNKLCVEKVDIFKHLSKNDLLDLLKIIKHKKFKKGESIFDVGDEFNTLYVVNSGRIKIHNYTYSGDDNILYFLESGDIFGEISLLKTSKFKHRGTAIKNTNLCMINKKDFDDLIQSKPSISIKIFESAYTRIKNLENHLQILQSNNAINKVAGFLLMKITNSNSNSFSINMTQKEIANYIGMRRETYSRYFNQLIDEKIINKKGKKINIIDMDHLVELSPILKDY